MVGLVVALVGEHLHGEEDILDDGHAVEECRALEEHPHLPAQAKELGLGHPDDIAPVEEDLSSVGLDEADHTLDEDGLPCTTSSDDEVGLSLLEGCIDHLDDLLVCEGLIE